MKHSLFQKSLLLLVALCSISVWAHNQNPAAIRRALDKAFQSLGAPPPANVLKGNRTLRLAGTNAQIFDVKKDQKTVASVAQLEIQESLNVVAVDVAQAKVTAVIRDGSPLNESEWQDFAFIAEVRKALSGK